MLGGSGARQAATVSPSSSSSASASPLTSASSASGSAAAAILGGYTAALGYALTRWTPSSAQRRRVGVGAASLLLYPAAYTLVEWFRGWFLSGFPWFALGYSQTDSPLAGFARRTVKTFTKSS